MKRKESKQQAQAEGETTAKTGERGKNKGKSSEHAEKALQAAQAEIAELKDKLLRQLAETENVRKRARREVEAASKFAIERFARAILDVVDNLERALASEHGNAEALREGVRLTLNAWHDVMRKFHIERVDALGRDFDPHLHEALAQVPDAAPAGRVIAQHAAGYTLHGRLLRPAKVIVSSGPVKEAEKKEEREEGGKPEDSGG